MKIMHSALTAHGQGMVIFKWHNHWVHLVANYLARAVSSPGPDLGKAVVCDFVALCPQFVPDFSKLFHPQWDAKRYPDLG